MIRQLGTEAEPTQVIFNNNYEDQGQRNARELTQMLDCRHAGGVLSESLGRLVRFATARESKTGETEAEQYKCGRFRNRPVADEMVRKSL